MRFYILLLFPLLNLTPTVLSIKCYECGYGIELDIAKFPKIFGQDKFSFSLSKSTEKYDKWCGISGRGQNESLVECEGNCALVRVTDGLSAIAGCAEVDNLKIETSYSTARIGKSQYEMFVCSQDACNENPDRARYAQKDYDKANPSSSTATANLFSAVGLLLMVFFVNNVH
ncbi:hypothetical protein M3Y98_01046000 [Aphelenchoides besseyi]|nr:hypothetical protein M3Y98_01046000 [Aphelenchoides besseyi]KAI6209834.1 hypothetical protein M3Y96_00263200 [Aphelenchoides besseyi]